MPLTQGQILNNRYRIVKLLGQGGFGAVYRAWDTTFNIPCALKENIEASPEAQRQFMREAQILHNLRHANLPLVKDYFLIPGQGQYLVMDYIEGEDLQTLIDQKNGPLPEAQVLMWVAQISDALSYMHSQNPPVIHRDIKPANIKITPDGKAVLVDFGIAKIYNPDARTTLGARAVTPGFSPFEQYGQAPTDARTDVYALAATTYALLTGVKPTESIARMAGTAMPGPRQLNPAITSPIEQVILKAMEVMPDQRYETIAEFKRALVTPSLEKAVVAQPVQRTNAPMAQPAVEAALPRHKPKGQAPVTRSRAWLWFLGGALILILLGFLVLKDTIFPTSSPTSTPEKAATLALVIPTNPLPNSPPTKVPTVSVDTTPIKIALLAPLTGGAPSFGVSSKEGVMLAFKEWNNRGGVLGRQLELIIEDSKCEADPAVVAANKVINQDKVHYIIGEICSKASIPVSEIANAKGVVQISPASSSLKLTLDNNRNTKPYTFRACFIDSFQGSAMARFAWQKGYKTAFVMFDPNNEYSKGLANSFSNAFMKEGGNILGEETYSNIDVDFSAILNKVADSGANVLFIPDYYYLVNQVAGQARNLKVVMLGGDGWDSSSLQLNLVNGGFYTTNYNPNDTRPIARAWVKTYSAEYKDDRGRPKIPDSVATLSYDAANILLEAIEKAGKDDPAVVKDTLESLTFDAVSGQIRFDSQHNPIKSVVIIGIKNGKTYYVDTINP